MITDNDNNNKVLFIFWNTFLDDDKVFFTFKQAACQDRSGDTRRIN